MTRHRVTRTLTRGGPVPPHRGPLGWLFNWLDRVLYRVAGH